MAHSGTVRKAATARRCLLCLALGAMITVAAAWGCALFVMVPWTSTRTADGPTYERLRPDAWPPLDTFFLSSVIGATERRAQGSVFRPGVHDYRSRVPPAATEYWISERRYGLPVRALSFFGNGGWYDMMRRPKTDTPAEQSPDFSVLEQGIVAPGWLPQRFHDRTLPLHPIWPGFMYSTLFYGAIAWLVLFIPGALRRSLRNRCGLCLHCKYPLADFTVCPECGRAVGALR